MEEFIIKSWSSSSSPHLGLILLGKPELSWFAFITPLPYPLSQNIFQVHPVLSTATTKYSKSLVQATFKIFIYLFIYLLIFGCDASLLLLVLFLVAASGGHSLVAVVASHCGGFSCGTQALGPGASVVVAPRL